MATRTIMSTPHVVSTFDLLHTTLSSCRALLLQPSWCITFPAPVTVKHALVEASAQACNHTSIVCSVSELRGYVEASSVTPPRAESRLKHTPQVYRSGSCPHHRRPSGGPNRGGTSPVFGMSRCGVPGKTAPGPLETAYAAIGCRRLQLEF
jgi:hypothetical protein